MNLEKSLLTCLGETLDQYQAKRRAAAQPLIRSERPSRLRWMGRQMLPNISTLLIVAVLILTQSVWARPFAAITNAPGPSATTVNYQGRLADNAGTPLDGSYGMSFALYDAASTGNLVWGPEDHPAVPVSDGLFSVGLGSRTAGGIPTTTWNGDRYLELTVGGETLEPRELIRSVPVAGMALTVPDGAIGTAQIADGSIGMDKLGEQPYYFHGAFATPTEWMADVVFNGNYERFCTAIGRTYVRADELQAHYHPDRGLGYFYNDWYYVGTRYCESDVHKWGDGDPNSVYNAWQYKGECGNTPGGHGATRERSAIIWCE